MDSIISGDRKLSVDHWAKKNGIDAKFARSLKDCLNEPDEVPYLIDRIIEAGRKIKNKSRNAVRNALIRVQMYCSIHGNSDPIKLSKQLYIAQTLEKLMFGTNLLLEAPSEEEED